MPLKHETGKYEVPADEPGPGPTAGAGAPQGGPLGLAGKKGKGKGKPGGSGKAGGGDEEWAETPVDPAAWREYVRSVPRHGSTAHRALDQGYVSRSAFANPGVFGRMFPTLPSVAFTEKSLAALAERMNDPAGGEDNPRLPAGFTFLGQFIDHDITFDPTSSLEKQNDPEAIHNFRTPLLELDNLYGSGPASHPFLYDRDSEGRKFLIGLDADGQPGDLPRNAQGTALIGDPRNDENLIVSQLHLAFLRFHNRVVDHLAAKGAEGGEPVPEEFLFEEAQRVVRWHYQWLIVHEFLPGTIGDELAAELLPVEHEGKIVGQDPIGNVLDERLKHFRFKEEPFIPVEFAVAAYRFGHSQIRPGYAINGDFGSRIFPGLAVPPNLDPQKRVLLGKRGLDFSRFFATGGAGPLQPGRQIDTRISGPLFTLPGETTPAMASLPLRNLRRGNAFRLPWGQRVAVAMGVAPLTDDELAAGDEPLAKLGFPQGKAPLWYYVLKEAETRAKGQHLGPVGGRIVGEVFLGLLKGDFKSYLTHDPLWRPFLPAAKAGTFTIADLVNFASSGA